MKIGYFILEGEQENRDRMICLLDELRTAGYEIYPIQTKADVLPDTDLVLSMGGDGTFLSAAHVVSDIGLPILGVNFGRIGFLCENRPEAVLQALMEGSFSIEYRTVLNATLKGPGARKNIGMLPYSVNEVSIHRSGASVLGAERRRTDLYAGYQGADSRADRPAQPQCPSAGPSGNGEGGHLDRVPGRCRHHVHGQSQCGD